MFRRIPFVVCAFLAAGVCHPEDVEPAGTDVATSLARTPNIIWIVLDAVRAENLSCYGYGRNTSPHIDALADEGVRCEWAFAQSHCTSWSTPSYLTGRYFPVFAVAFGSWRELWRTSPPEERFLPEIASENGYKTALFTATPWLSATSRLSRMFEDRHDIGDPGSVETVNAAFFPWLENNGDRPFFAYIHTVETHFPHLLEHISPGHDQWVDKDDGDVLALSRQGDERLGDFSEKQRQVFLGLYDGSIHYEDEHVGRLIEKCKDLGIYDNTLFVICADHGEALAENGKFLGHFEKWVFEQVLRVPLIMAGPGIPKGKRIADLTELVDVVPTLIELCAFRTAAKTQGKSLLPLFNGQLDGKLRNYVFARYKSQAIVDEVPAMVLRGDLSGRPRTDATYKYEWNPHTGEEHLWVLPDRLGNRVDRIHEAREEADRMKGIIQKRYWPLWEQYANLPRTTPQVFFEEFNPRFLTTPDVAVWEPRGQETWDDHKWSLVGDYLASCGWREDAPPITFEFEVPNGTFNVEMSVMHRASSPPEIKPASSFQIAIEGNRAKRVTPLGMAPKRANRYTYVGLGEYTVDDDTFTITLDEGAPGYWAVARRLKFTPVEAMDQDGQPPDTQAAERQLEALGYLD